MTTVQDVLVEPGSDGPGAVLAAITAASLLPVAIAGRVGPARVAQAAWELFDVPLGDLVVRGWERHRLIERAKRETAGQPEATEQVSVAGHTFKSRHRPRLECDIEGQTIPILTFELSLSLAIETAVVTVRGGEVVSVSPAVARAEAALAAGGHTILHRETPRVSLPAWRARPAGAED